MTAYSFGARWVGVVALREPPSPEPLHKMALRLRKASVSRVIRIDQSVTLPADELLKTLAGIRIRLGIAGQAARSQECLRVDQAIRSGRRPLLRPWLQTEILQAHGAGHVKDYIRAADEGPDLRSPDTSRVATGWATSYPQAPDSPWVPEASLHLLRDLQRMNLELDEEAILWVRWASLHRSYLYESVPNSPMSASVLDLLAMLGRGSMRLALLEHARSRRGEFASNAEASAVLAKDQEVRSALATWLAETGSAHFGKGEMGLLTAGQKTTAPEAVAMQLLGALSLITASQAPVDRLLEMVSFELSGPEPDWQELLTAHLRGQPRFTRTESGPDHNKTFTVTVEGDGHSASAAGASAKAARKSAARAYVREYLPHAIPRSPAHGQAPPRPLPYRANLPQHTLARDWAQAAFEVADSGLISQALTHRSWIHENRALVAAAHQRDYGTLATEGSEILTQLVRHHYALDVLNGSFLIPATAVTSPAVTREVVAALFDQMPVASGVLTSSGTRLTPDIKEDVAQAIAAAAWRANGDLLMEQQALTLARWIRSFTVADDPATQLQEYCSRAKVAYVTNFEQRGPDHQQEYLATIKFDVDATPTWRGPWRSSKTAAKQAAAVSALEYLSGSAPEHHLLGEGLVRALLMAELRAIDPLQMSPQRELAVGRLGVDLLATGAYDQYLLWSRARSELIPSSKSGVINRLRQYYETVLKWQRREAVRRWTIENTPARGVRDPDITERIRTWWASKAAGRLALLEELLSAMQTKEPAAAILDFVGAQAEAVAAAAGATLETELSEDTARRTLTIRLSGAELSQTMEPVVNVVEAVMGGSTWAREPQAVSVTLGVTPTATDPLSDAGMQAVHRALHDPWLARIQSSLADFLALTERLLADNSDPTPAQLEQLALAELSLVLQLRTADEKGE